jgi:hypothetical protein
VANLVETVTPGRLARIVRASTMDADPELAQQDADSCAQERGVWVGQSNLHGTRTVVMKAAAGDVIRFDAATDHLADVLAQLDDTDTKDQRRAKAVGWLADPQSPSICGPRPGAPTPAAAAATSSLTRIPTAGRGCELYRTRCPVTPTRLRRVLPGREAAVGTRSTCT